MNSAGRLGLYGAGVAAVFALAYSTAAAVVPESVVSAWTGGTTMEDHESETHGAPAHTPAGLSLSANGYALSPVRAPARAGESGELTFQVVDAKLEPLLDYGRSHEKDLHLVVVRSDGAHFRHVHPVLDSATGTWSIPWTWDEAGTYRVYTDFAPSAEQGHDSVTLTRTVDVAGDFEPTPAVAEKRRDEVDGFDVSLEGRLVAGSAEELTITVRREGEPVTELEPYLGAFGHLVALRDGDLAYLHVHAEGDEPEAGATAGPEIRFAAETPTAGRYLLYLDFQVDGEVHSADFVLEAAADGAAGSHGHSHSAH